MRITADTITLAQIDSVWRIGVDATDPDTMHDATVAANRHGDFSVSEQRAARRRCAEILNARGGES